LAQCLSATFGQGATRRKSKYVEEHKDRLLSPNAIYQGRFDTLSNLATLLGIQKKFVDDLTFNMSIKIGKKEQKVSCFNTMAAGLKYADRVFTVSPTYAEEVSTDEEKGAELERMFKAARVTGILNGVKEGISPTNPVFMQKAGLTCGTFNHLNVDTAKADLKATYRALADLPDINGPLIVYLGRMDTQKSYDLTVEALTEVLRDTQMQVVVVGTGTDALLEKTKTLQKQHPGKIYYAGWMGPERYALLAGSDYVLMFSRWEPCGLVQMEAMRFGTLPLIAPTGGLVDTVQDDITGFATDIPMSHETGVDKASVDSIAKCLRRAARAYTSNPGKISQMRKAAMAASVEYTWTNSALQYEKVFGEMGVVDKLPACGGPQYVTLETDNQVC